MDRLSMFGTSKRNSYSGTTILVCLCVLALVELTQGCHRRVEYHHYYKKHPHGPHGHRGHHGHHGQHGHQGHHGKGYGHGHEGYGQGHGGHGHGHGGHGHGHGGHGHGGGHGKGGGHHGGYGHEGGGHGHQQKGYGHGHGGGKGYGGGHHEGYKGDSGHGGYGHHGHDEYGHGGHQGGHMHYEDPYGHGGGGHGGNGKGHKGHKYKYQMYESTHYNDKDGYSSNAKPHYLKKGYGYSGPYPNTEYSNPVAASVDPPTHISGGLNGNSYNIVGGTSNLDAADTANLIRNTYDSKENEIIAQPFGTFGTSGDGALLLSDSSGGSEPIADVIHTVPSPVTRGTDGSFESKVDAATGNFDLNLNYNSDLPVPFRRSFVGGEHSTDGIGHRKRKRISSKYRAPSSSSSEPLQSQSEQKPETVYPSSVEIEQTSVKSKPPEFVEFMNF